MKVVNEKSSFSLEIEFLFPENGELHTDVERVSWWVAEPRRSIVTHEVQVLEHPNNPLTIFIPASANICSGKRNEQRIVVIKAESGDNKEHVDYEYTVRAIPTVPISA